MADDVPVTELIRTEIDVRGVATVNRLATANQPAIHRFPDGSDTMEVRASDESTGIGDIILRGKWNFLRADRVNLAAAMDLRLPTGDEDELRGLDTVRVSPFFIASANVFGISPHVNLGFDIGDTSKIDNEFFYRVGVDWTPHRIITVAVDILGEYILNNSRVQTNGEPAGSNIINGSVGFKVNVWKNVLLLANTLIRLNDTGLRANFVPFVGLEVDF